MKRRKKYDILDDVKNFPKVTVSDNFMNDLHDKLDRIIPEEKENITTSDSKAGFLSAADRFREFLSGLFAKKYLVPAFVTALIIAAVIYFYNRNDGSRLNESNVIVDSADTTRKTKENELKLPVKDTGTSVELIDPRKEITKFITKGKDAAEENSKLLLALLRDKESELKLFRPDDVIRNFGKFDLAGAFKEMRYVSLRSRSLDIKNLDHLKEKIDSISK